MISIRSLLCVLLLACVGAAGAATFSQTGFAEAQVASGLDPTTMTFAPDGRLFVCEKPGRVRVIKNGALLTTPFVDLSASVDNFNERGLMSVCFDPQFTSNGWVYVYYTRKEGTARFHRVGRFTASGDVASGGETVIIDLSMLGGAGNHNGGGLRFGQDGKLYISTGENANGGNAQSTDNQLGKLLRINKDGTIPGDNPNLALTGNNRAIVALGLRNAFTLAVQPGTGLLYVNDVGQSYEEIHRYDTGSAPVALNYGWNSIDGPRTTQTAPAGYRDPVNAFNTGKSAICGGDFYNPASPGADAFPSGTYGGRYFFCDYSGWIKYIDPASPGTRHDFATGIARPIDVEIAADGALWYIARAGQGGGSDADNTSTSNGTIWRVRYIGGGGPTKLGFLQQPSNAGSGVAISPAVRVAVQDANGSTVTSATNTVTIAIGTNAGSGTLSGTLSVAAVGGVATFANLSINNAGTGYTLNASSSGLTGVGSNAFNVMAQAALPTITPNGGAFSGPVWVQLASATPGATIRYTTDGSTPSGSSPAYSAPFQRTATTTVRAIAQKSGLSDSGVAGATITISGTTAYGLDYRPPLTGVAMPATVGGSLPGTLTGTGLFTSTSALTAKDALVPYDVNSPLWSDNAQKQRWIGLPGSARIAFAPTGEYAWPGGTVFIKHFELVTNEGTGAKRRLETRVLVLDAAGTNGYGVTYKWRADNSEADLVAATGQDEAITITAAGGGTRSQTWRYPSRDQCLQCHTTTAGFVLGPKTRQLNGTYAYPTTGRSDNQLRTWSYLQMFTAPVSESAIAGYAKMVKVGDSGATLEHRVRSYLDANCANCHRPGGTASQWDARYDTPLFDQNIIDGAVRDALGIAGAKVVVPQDVPRSIMHLRMQSTVAAQQMPPLARNVVDTAAVATLAQWIGTLPRGGSGSILREYWTGHSGNAVSAIPLASAPSGTSQLSSFEAPTDWADSYGTRVRGWVTPPATGTYTFWIAGDDNCELHLSTDDTVGAKRLIASVPEWTGPREWTKFAQQTSAGIALNAGQRYWIEALQKEGGGGDNLAVAWQGPGLSQRVIAGQHLTPAPGGAAPVFTSVVVTPVNATVVKGGTVQYVARARDENGADLSPQPGFTWTTTGGGAIAANGLFTSSANGTFTVTAQATVSGTTRSGATQVTVTEPIAVKINFQPAASPTVSGYLVDGGLVYAGRGNGYTYGWSGDVTDTARDRNAISDQLRDTLLHLQKPAVPDARWEIAVPNGRYQVFLVSGDPSHFDGTYRVNIEGVLGISGTPSDGTRFFDSGSAFQVQVGDGRLTLTNGSGAVNNKVCFIEITQVPVAVN